MAGLLSEAEEAEARAAIQSVTDTFFLTPITYKLAISTFDRFEEDRKATYTDYALKGLEEYKAADMKEEIVGSKDFNDVKITFNIDDLIVKSLITAEFGHKFTVEKDYFILKSQTYRVTDIHFDGPLSSKSCLVIMYGKLCETTF